MTDKQRILYEIERKYEEWKLGNSAEAKYRREAYKELIELIKPTQEEPVNSIWHDASEKSNKAEDVVVINPSDNTGEVLTGCIKVYQGRIWAYTSVLLNLDNPCKIGKNLQKEPVREELEQAAITAANEDMQGRQIMEESNENRQLYSRIFRRAFKAGAKWQYEQFENNRLAACDRQTKEEAEIEMNFVTSIIEKEHRLPTYDDAIKYGMELKEQQMIDSAIDATIGYWNHSGLSIDVKLLKDLKEGSKCKLIIIKDK